MFIVEKRRMRALYLRTYLPLTPNYYIILVLNFANRYFQVHYGSVYFSIVDITAGILQGGILSLVFYNIYIYISDQPITRNTLVVDYSNDKEIILINTDPFYSF